MSSVDAPPGALDTSPWANADRRRVAARVVRSWAAAVAIVVAIMSACGLLITHALADTSLGRLDRRVALHLFASRTARLDRFTGWGTFPADPIPVAVIWVSAMAIAYVLIRRVEAPLFILLAVGGEKTSYFLTTLIVRRSRPDIPTIGVRHVTSSFPSGHVGSAVSLYGALAILVVAHATRRSPVAKVSAVLLVLAVAATVGFCRMYRGFHFLTDVVAGALVGGSWLIIAGRVLRSSRGHEREAHDVRGRVRVRGDSP